MAKADLTAERLRELISYDKETGLFTWLVVRNCGRYGATWPGMIAGTSMKFGYICIGIDGYRYTAHRLAWLYMTGAWPVGSIDHINRKPGDNRFINLRCISHKQNSENKSLNKNNTSGYKGVYLLPSGKWNVKIKHNYKSICIGTFVCKEEAKAARAAFELKIFTHSALMPLPENLERHALPGETEFRTL